MGAEYMGLQAEYDREEKSYNDSYAEDKSDLTLYMDELELFDFVMEASKCGGTVFDVDGTPLNSLLQKGKRDPGLKICDHGGELELKFSDPKLQARVSRLMTPSGRKKLSQALGLMSEVKVSSKVPPSMTNTTTTPPPPTYEDTETDTLTPNSGDGLWAK